MAGGTVETSTHAEAEYPNNGHMLYACRCKHGSEPLLAKENRHEQAEPPQKQKVK